MAAFRRRHIGAVSVTLRALRDDDAAWLDPWLAPVAASAGYAAIDAGAPAASLLQRIDGDPTIRVRVIVRERPVGIVVYREDHSSGVGTFELVATEPTEARRGSGMRAAALAEDEMRDSGARVLYAPAAEVHGIGVYFWIRLGYRPVLRAEWPCAVEGVAWLRRDLADDQTKGMMPLTKSNALTPK